MGIFYNNEYDGYINEFNTNFNIMEETYKIFYESQLEYNKIFTECGILLESEGSFKERIKALIKRFIEWLKHIKDKIKALYNKIKSKFRIQELEYEKAIKEWESMQNDTDYKYEMEEFEAEYINANVLDSLLSGYNIDQLQYLNIHKFTDSNDTENDIQRSI